MIRSLLPCFWIPTEPRPTEPAPSDPPTPPRPPRPDPTPEPMSENKAKDKTEPETEPETETYDAKICTVKLLNADLSHLPVYYLSERELERYSVYMRSLGWRPDLFPDSPYVSLYGNGYSFYAIPTEALADEVFAAMMQEATKYLGYPYVWGGASPSTSFDCSGFVSWVINHTVVNDELVWGYFGRRGATALYYMCTPTSTPHPGDLVFFEKTYVDTPDVICTHVGRYSQMHFDIPKLSSEYGTIKKTSLVLVVIVLNDEVSHTWVAHPLELRRNYIIHVALPDNKTQTYVPSSDLGVKWWQVEGE